MSPCLLRVHAPAVGARRSVHVTTRIHLDVQALYARATTLARASPAPNKRSSEGTGHARATQASSPVSNVISENSKGSRKTAKNKPGPAPTSRQGRIVHHLVELNRFDESFLEQQPVNTLNWCIKILGKYGRPELSEQLFHWLRLKGKANEHSLIKLFEGLEEARCPPSRAVRAWRNVSRMQCPFTPSYKSTASLLKTFRPSKDLRGATRILKEVKLRKLPLNEYGYNTVIRIAADVGDVATAFALEEELRNSDELNSDLRTYSSLMHALSASQKWSQTRNVEALLRSAGLRPDATLALQLMSGYARCGWPAGAEAVLDELMEDYRNYTNGAGTSKSATSKPNRSHWNSLLNAYSTARQYQGCLMAYNRMVNKVGIRPDGYTMVALLKAGKRSQTGRTAVSFVLSEVEKYNIPMTVELASSAIACCRISPYVSQEEADKSRQLANHVWDIMTESGVKPNRIAFNTLLAARADARDTVGVQELYNALEADDAVMPDAATWRIMMRAFEKDYPTYERYADLANTWTTLFPLDEGRNSNDSKNSNDTA